KATLDKNGKNVETEYQMAGGTVEITVPVLKDLLSNLSGTLNEDLPKELVVDPENLCSALGDVTATLGDIAGNDGVPGLDQLLDSLSDIPLIGDLVGGLSGDTSLGDLCTDDSVPDEVRELLQIKVSGLNNLSELIGDLSDQG